MDGRPPSYAETLRAAIDAAGSSRRKLSYALADKTGNKQTSEYRSLGKYMADAKPGKKPEIPDQDRAAVLAVELKEPRLAIVSPVADRRRGRQAELEARVAELEALANVVMPQLEELGGRVVALEQRRSTKQRKDVTGQ